jgi:hypothetical protein
MSKGKAWRLGGFVAALAASAGLIASASGATGAYFNDTKSGTVDGSIGSIKVSTSGGGGNDNLNFTFADLLPGTPQTASVGFTNIGHNAEDVYLVFNNAGALHALNNMGRYGQVMISSTRMAGTQDGYLFESSNLNDSLDYKLAVDSNCSPLPAAFPGNETEADAIAAKLKQPGAVNPCWPVPNVIKIASSLAPSATGTLKFSFGLGAVWKDPATENAPHFLCYPLVQDPSSTNPASQICTTTGTQQFGLPYQIVATQVGIAPSDPLNSTPTP